MDFQKNAGSSSNRQHNGFDAQNFASRRVRLVFDAESVQHPGFHTFAEAWKGVNPPSWAHIPSFEYNKLSGAYRSDVDMLIAARRMSVLDCGQEVDYAGIFDKLFSMKAQRVGIVVGKSVDLTSIMESNKTDLQDVRLYSITDRGTLLGRFVPNGKGNSSRFNKNRPFDGGEKRPYNGFMIANKPEALMISILRHRLPIGLSSTVYDANKTAYQLKSEVMVNADSITYATNQQGVWAKIYVGKSLTTLAEAKTQRMLSKEVKIEGLCWPTGILYDSDDVFAGQLIPSAEGTPLSQCVFKGIDNGIRTSFPNWDKRQLTRLAITILTIVNSIHRMGILLGCLNPASILVKDENTVYFTDTDQYQVEGFPCIMRNVMFTPPELQDKLRRNKMYLCTRDNENYEVALLLFMLMMPGKMPYTIEDNIHAPDAIIAQQFAFSYKGQHGSDKTVGSWRFVWSHLTPFKEMFYRTFQNGERFNAPENRPNDRRWIKITEEFSAELNGDNIYDPHTRELLPKSFKRSVGNEFVRCRYCNIEHPRTYFRNEYFKDYQICNSCLERPSKVSFTCVDCGRTFIYTNRTAIFHERKRERDDDWKTQKHCQDCKSKLTRCIRCGKTVPLYKTKDGVCFDCENAERERERNRKNEIYTTVRCKGCGQYFQITVGEHESLQSKGFRDPIRCKNCRNARKQSRF